MKFLCFIGIALISSASAVSLKYGVKDLTDEQVAYSKLDYEDQEKADIMSSIKEAEQELGKKMAPNSKEGQNLASTIIGKQRKFDDSDILNDVSQQQLKMDLDRQTNIN